LRSGRISGARVAGARKDVDAVALTGAFERFEPDFAGVRQVPAGDQIVIAGRLFVPFEAKEV
jgi:hypothetical protein